MQVERKMEENKKQMQTWRQQLEDSINRLEGLLERIRKTTNEQLKGDSEAQRKDIAAKIKKIHEDRGVTQEELVQLSELESLVNKLLMDPKTSPHLKAIHLKEKLDRANGYLQGLVEMLKLDSQLSGVLRELKSQEDDAKRLGQLLDDPENPVDSYVSEVYSGRKGRAGPHSRRFDGRVSTLPSPQTRADARHHRLAETHLERDRGSDFGEEQGEMCALRQAVRV